MKKADNEIILEVPKELRNMAFDIKYLGGGDTEKILERALRLGLAHLLVLEEEDARCRMNQM